MPKSQQLHLPPLMAVGLWIKAFVRLGVCINYCIIPLSFLRNFFFSANVSASLEAFVTENGVIFLH